MVAEDRRDPSVLTLDKTLPTRQTSLEATLPATPVPKETRETVATRDSVPRGLGKTLPPIDRGRFHIEGEVGRGGLGRVLRARDVALGRPVAIKELLVAGEAAQRRFVREALITARLQHPAIVPIYDAGQGETEPFYAMRLVSGRSLGDVLADTKTLEERLALLPSLITVADAVAYAHGQKIIHRDLKPHNVLVGNFGEIVVIDWGLAKDLAAVEDEAGESVRATASSLETIDGAVMGTPAYMSPEQANGDDVDERADVYALGAILYHVIAGTAPHTGKSLDEMLVKISEGDVVPLSTREPDVPADLAAIVAKAMAADKTQRYRTARELAQDLHRFQTGQLVGAHRYTAAERLRRWVRRYRGMVAVTAIASAILIAYGAWSVRRIVAERREAEAKATAAATAQREAAVQRDEAITQSMLVRAREYAASGHSAEEMAVLRALARADAPEAARRLAVREGGLVWKAHQRLAMALGRDTGFVYRSADGARFVAQEPLGLVAWEASTGKELARVPLPAGGQVVGVSPTARFVAILVCARRGDSCSGLVAGDTLLVQPDASVELRELAGTAASRALATWQPGERVSGRTLAFAVDDSALVVRAGAALRVLDASGATLRELDPGAACIGRLAIAPRGDAVAVACADRVLLARAADAKPVALAVKPTPATVLHFVAPDRLLVVGDRVQLWDVPTGELRGEGAWPAGDSPTAGHGERRDLEWELVEPAPAVGAAQRRIVLAPQLVLASTRPQVDRTSVLGPATRALAGGGLVTLEDAWRAISVQGDQVHLALLDEMLPAPPADHCLPRVGGEARATLVLDGGARLLVDEQEVPAGIFAAPPEGYRHTTSVELPVRQLRPLIAAEDDICLVWGGAIGARAVDGGELAATATAVDDGEGGLVVLAGTGAGVHITKAGARTPLTIGQDAVVAPGATHVASFDVAAKAAIITDVATGKVVRSVPLPDKKAVRGLAWAARDVAELTTDAAALLVPADPKLAVRPREHALVTDEKSPYATQLAGVEVTVVRVRDGATIARHSTAGASVRILPDPSGRVLVRRDTSATVVAPDGAAMPLVPPPTRTPDELEVIGNHLLARNGSEIELWDLATGKGRKLSGEIAINDREIWTVTGQRQPHLDRAQLHAMRGTDVELATAGLPFHRIRGDLQVSPDGRRLTATYEVTEERTAIATWDATTGDLLWVGPPTARVIGDWVLAGGRAFVPRFDLPSILADTGARTNLRVCKTDLRAIAVVPSPPSDSTWAPDAACGH